MSDIKTFRAETMNEALTLVREELGQDALILHTRQIPIKTMFPWQKEKVETEIVALPAEEKAERRPRTELTPPSRTTERHSGQSNEPRLEKRFDSIPQDNHLPLNSTPSRSSFSSQDSSSKQPLGQDRYSELERVLEQKQAEINNASQSKLTETKPKRQTESEKLEAMVTERIDALQAVIERLSQQVQASSSPNVPSELFDVYTELIDAEIEEDSARELITRLRQRCSENDIKDPEQVRAFLLGMIESQINCRGAIQVTPGQQKIVALVGPTGVGKTTTIAKLAANFRLRDNIRMGLITVDTYRIAAVEQLRTYAEIIDLPMKVVTTTTEMKNAVDELAEMDLILIDTAGRSPQDDLRIQELKNHLSEIIVDEVHLVLSAVTGYRHLKKTVEKFSSISPTSVILTKLDEAPSLGALVNLSGKLGQSLSYLTTGQNVPNDIEPAESSRVANLILGNETVET